MIVYKICRKDGGGFRKGDGLVTSTFGKIWTNIRNLRLALGCNPLQPNEEIVAYELTELQRGTEDILPARRS